MSKKLVNSVENAVDEALAGFVSIHTGVQLLDGCRGAVRSDLDDIRKKGQVLLLCGGGSGHEPAFVGYVGPGMLTAAVPGAVFASPPPTDIQTTLETIGHDHPAGVLVIVFNYTGDRLNFGIAVENAKRAGVRVETLTVGEDCALASHDRTAGRRGLAGAIFLLKVAGALAEDGRPLEEVHQAAVEVTQRLGTIGLSLSPCSVPGRPPTFSLGPDEMELGLGVHGEAGVRRMKILPARDAVAAMLDHMTNPESSTCLSINKGDHVALLINNLGGTSQLELGIVTNEAIKYIESRGAYVDRAYCGGFVTSMEMAGISLSVLHLTDNIKRNLDAPTTVVGWMRPLLASGETDRITPNHRPVVKSSALKRTQRGATCNDKVAGLIFSALSQICRSLIENSDQLDELDSQSGDGDCGTTLKRGAEAILAAVGEKNNPSLNVREPHHLMSQLSDIVSHSMGGTSGALYSLFFSAFSGCLVESCNLESWLRGYKVGMEAIMKYGKAELGDRTMLDAMNAGFVGLSTNMNKGPKKALEMAVISCDEGARSTAGMKAYAGRASYVHSDNLRYPDPGAVAFSICMQSLYDAFNTNLL